MREIEQEKLEEILQNHKLWLETRFTPEVKGKRADLYEVYLRGADLQGANLQGADLSGANLQGADLSGAYLQEASLQGAYLQGANLYRADLQVANLREADLQGAYLHGADLSGAYLREANLQGANLHRANLHGADLRGANLQETYLDFASLPLWCGGLHWKLDKRIMLQLLYHFCSYECEDKEIKEAQNYLLPLANQFHRIGADCQKLEPKEIKEITEEKRNGREKN
ncbi:MAG TPA: pentapeptide repeat-containing protein [Clostridiales bacterium]|nr:pentapeptide repeat-containing protein [Clostridiales bacterium]